MAKQRRSLSGKVVAITGAARGIGKATAEALVRKGCRVAIGDLDLPLAERTAAELGGGTIAVALDVTDRGSLAAFLGEAERQLGPLDVVINNAGIMPVTPFVEEGEDSIRRQVDINLLRRDQPARSWRSSGCARATPATSSTSPPRPAKAASRASPPTRHQARRGRLQRGGARRAARQRIEVSCVMPTVVNTELTAGVGAEADQTGRGRGRRRRDRRRARGVALRRLGAALQRRPVQVRRPAAASLARGARALHEGRQTDDRSRPQRPPRLRGAGGAQRARGGPGVGERRRVRGTKGRIVNSKGLPGYNR